MKCPFLCKWNTWQSGCTKPTLERCPHGRAVDCLCGAGRGSNETQPCTDPKPETKAGDIIYVGGKSMSVPRPMTKADRIRSKTDEGLAEFLFHVFHSPIKPLSKEELLEVLQEPAEEE